MLRPRERVVVAVSGGPDSVCLLDVLCELAPKFEITVAGVAHLNHKLRGKESDEDEQFVQEVARMYGLSFFREQANLTGTGNLEEVARDARRRFFRKLIADGVAEKIATGHTLDDQAETVLFRILRGAGPPGIAGILPVTTEGLIRPLIDVTRTQVLDYLVSRGLRWREDSTNCDPRFSRNRIRHELLPQLKRDWNPRIAETLTRSAEIAYDEEKWWESEIHSVAPRLFKRIAGGVEVRADEIARLPKALARRLIRHAIQHVRGVPSPPSFEYVERVMDLARRTNGEGRIQLNDVEVFRSFRLIRFQPKVLVHSPFPILVEVPGCYAWTDSVIYFELSPDRADCASLRLRGQGELTPLELRTWRAGDHYCPAGKSRDYSLHELFQRAQVPSWRRHRWPIVTLGSRIAWVRQFGAASEFCANDGLGPALRIWEEFLPNDESLPFKTAS
jgi:tRNA(Ile)-lysidine synthase